MKIAFPSEREARRDVGPREGRRERIETLDVYECPHCGFWHQGNKLLAQREYKNQVAEEAEMIRRCALDYRVDSAGDSGAAVEGQHQITPEN